MDMIKKNITLAIGLAIPIVMILFVAGSIYLPGLFIKPHFNFLYVSGDGPYYYSGYEYVVQNGTLVKNDITAAGGGSNRATRRESKLYLYDVAKGVSTEVSFAAAQKLQIDGSLKSPDGFEVVYGSRDSGFFPFFYGGKVDYSARYLKGNNVSKKLNLQLDGGSYYNDFRFVGWIK